MGSLFKRGYEASRKEIAKQEEMNKKMGNRIFRFFASKPERGKSSVENDVIFLTEEPVNFDEHMITRGDKFYNYTCIGKDCPLCADGVKKTAKGAYLIIDLKHFEYTSRNTGKKVEGDERLALYVQGMRVVGQLDRIHEKRGGVSNREMTIVRMGTGTSTTYTFEPGDKVNLSKRYIENLMSDGIRESWDGTKEGLMDIIEEQLKMDAPEVDDYEEFGYDSDDDFSVSSDRDFDEPKPSEGNKKKKKAKLSSRLRKKGNDEEDEGFMTIDPEEDDDYKEFS